MIAGSQPWQLSLATRPNAGRVRENSPAGWAEVVVRYHGRGARLVARFRPMSLFQA